MWFIAAAKSWGPFGAFLIAFGDSAFVPLPQGVDALLITQALASPEKALLAAALAVLGSVLGSLILYGIARKAGRLALESRVSEKGIAKLEEQTRRYGPLGVVVPMMVPLPLPTKIFVIAAGVFQMKIWHFLAATAFGRAVRYGGEVWLALEYGERATAVIKRNAPMAGIAAVVLIALFFLVHRWSTQRVTSGA